MFSFKLTELAKLTDLVRIFKAHPKYDFHGIADLVIRVKPQNHLEADQNYVFANNPKPSS